MLRQLVSLFVALCIGFAPQLSFGVVRSNGVNTGNVSITGGTSANVTVSGTTNGVYTPSGIGAVSAIPFIHLSSGTVSAAGAISAITALPQIYPSAYCWFPANALATVLAAGWYYCTFTGTQAGTAFLNTYTSGAPAIPGAPTAVVDGKGAFVSDTASHNGPTISIPGNSLGINGELVVETDWEFTNSAGTKTLGITFGTLTSLALALTTQVSAQTLHRISNSGVTGKQFSRGSIFLGSSATSFSGPTLGTVDTTASQNVVFPLVKNTATDNLVLDRYSIAVMYSS